MKRCCVIQANFMVSNTRIYVLLLVILLIMANHLLFFHGPKVRTNISHFYNYLWSFSVGNLKMFLRRCQLRSPKSGPSSKSYISTIDLISIGQSAAEALYFLEQSKIIHGDIAARNCALGAKNKFYLCDRALSQDLFSSDYEVVGNFLLPVRWSPPEALDCPSQTRHG